MIFARKIYKIPELYDFCPKMPGFYIMIARKIFSFPNFRGHAPPPPPVSYAYMPDSGMAAARVLNARCSNFTQTDRVASRKCVGRAVNASLRKSDFTITVSARDDV